MFHVAPYLLLFLPLILSVFCFLINFRKSDFVIFFTCAILMLLLAVKIGFYVKTSEVVKSDVGLGVLSIPTEYYIDFLSIFFLTVIIFARILMAFLYKSDIASFFNRDNCQLFYVVGLLNLFGLTGIFVSGNIFNLFIFIEIYCLTFCAIMALSDDLELSKLAFKYFCQNVSAGILLLLALILLYASTGSLQISEISLKLEQQNAAMNWLLLPILIAVFLKFFPVWLYFKKLNSQDSLTGFLLNFAFIINSGVGLYLLIRFLFYLFSADLIFLNLKLDFDIMFIGLLLVCYGNYKIFKSQNLTEISAFLAISNLGFIVIALDSFSPESSRTMFFYIANYFLINLLFFTATDYLRKNFPSCDIENLKSINWQTSTTANSLVYLILLTPIGLMFWANWNLILGAADIATNIIAIISILISGLTSTNLAIKITSHNPLVHQ